MNDLARIFNAPRRGGLGEVGTIPNAYGPRNFVRSRAGLTVSSDKPGRVAAMSTIAQVIAYARNGFAACERNRLAVGAADLTYAKWTSAQDKYRWAYDLATWMITQSPTTAEFPGLMANLKGALVAADAMADDAAGRRPANPQPVIVDGRGEPVVLNPPAEEPVGPAYQPPAQEAGMFGGIGNLLKSPLALAAIGFGAMVLLKGKKRRNPGKPKWLVPVALAGGAAYLLTRKSSGGGFANTPQTLASQSPEQAASLRQQYDAWLVNAWTQDGSPRIGIAMWERMRGLTFETWAARELAGRV